MKNEFSIPKGFIVSAQEAAYQKADVYKSQLELVEELESELAAKKITLSNTRKALQEMALFLNEHSPSATGNWLLALGICGEKLKFPLETQDQKEYILAMETLNEKELQDDYPVYADYFYVCDGVVIQSIA